MKKLFLFFFCISLFVSCGSDNDEIGGGDGGSTAIQKTLTYKFAKNLSPNGTNNLIGVQVYANNTPYAYGVFDDFSKIKLELPDGKLYTFKSSIVINGKNKVAKDDVGYLKPFSVNNVGVPCANSFVLSSSEMSGLKESTTSMVNDNGGVKSLSTSPFSNYKIPRLDRYYGELIDFSPSNSVNPEIDMIRQVFGIRFTVSFVGDRVKPTDFFCLKIEGASDSLVVRASDEIKSVEAIYTFLDFESENESKGAIYMNTYFKTTGVIPDKKIIQPLSDYNAYVWKNTLTEATVEYYTEETVSGFRNITCYAIEEYD